jgi:predicted P-loop ATPase
VADGNGSNDNVVHIGAPQTWRDLCQKGADKKSLRANVHNAVIALTHDPAVRDFVAYDEMLRAPVVMHEIGMLDTCHRWLTDTDVIGVLLWLQRNGFPGIGLDAVRTAVQKRAEECTYHPVKQYLRSLAWDGVKRIGVWLPRYLGTQFTPYTQHVGRMFMVQMVARIADAGCQADHMMVLEGPQGVLKSSACRVLGGEWYSDHLPDITNAKEASHHLRGKWIIEVAELHATNKAEATMLKSFITRTHERYRPVWGRQEVLEPRQCVFVGTTNQDTYLRDPSGGRRFWPVRTAVDAPIDLERLAEDRDQLLAEAVHCYKQGDPWWPDASFEREFIAEEQQARYQGDIWEDKICQFVAAERKVTIAKIASECLAIPSNQMQPTHGTRIAAVLREKGWIARRNSKERWWELPP